MTTYIAQFTARHRLIQLKQQSVFIWQQESGEVDTGMLAGKIARESSRHFYRLVAGEQFEIALEDIEVEIVRAVPFNG